MRRVVPLLSVLALSHLVLTPLAWAEPEAPSPPSAGSAPQVRAPQILTRVDAEFPPGALQRGIFGTVVLEVTVAADGSVQQAAVATSIDSDLDAAALAAVRQWTFEPGRRGDEAVAARIRIPFEFAPPAAGTEQGNGNPSPEPPETAPDQPKTGGTDAQAASAPPNAPLSAAPRAEAASPEASNAPQAAEGEVVVTGQRNARAPLRSASDYHVHRDVLEAAPHAEGADVLRTAPGLYLARPEGGAVAHRYVLRGFDSEHGQDIEFKVGGIPINLPSHIHGQGYADLGFLIAETVDSLHVTEGVHDPRQGDFAVAGSIELNLARRERGVLLQAGYGSFGSIKALGMWAPKTQLPDSFGAVHFEQTDGYGKNRAATQASAVIQQGFTLGDWRLQATAILHVARAQLAGVVRNDDVAAGVVDFYGVYPYPTATAQAALSGRAITGLRGFFNGQDGDLGQLGLWLSVDDFRLRENYTGFLQRSQTLSNVTGRGDLIEQRNFTRSIGADGNYRTAPRDLFGHFPLTLELGASGRVDAIDQAQNLLDAAVRSETWDRRIDANVLGFNVAGYADVDLHAHERLRVRVGVRADALGYDVDDRLGNFAPTIRAQDQFVPGYRRSAVGTAIGPRASADFDALSWLTLHAAYGQGYRSPQARSLDDGERAPFTSVRSFDAGVRIFSDEDAHLSLSAYQTDLSDDVAFDAEEGRLERVGRTRRRGAVVEFSAKPLPFIITSASCTYVDAVLLEPPPATPENPSPPFFRGQSLPFVPPLVVRADVGASHALYDELKGSVGLGFSALSARPLPYGDYSAPVALLDGSLGVSYQPWKLGLEVFNVLDTRYAALELTFPSNWAPATPPSRLPARHSVAGAPRTLMLTLELSL